MRPAPRSHPLAGNRRSRGATLLEACAAMAVMSLASMAFASGVRPLACALRVEAARSTLVDTMLEARRRAYRSESNVAVLTGVGSDAVRIGTGAPRPLGDGVSISAAPSDGDVTFRGTGLADNATVAIACGASTASVVVNQRGVVR